MPTYDYRCSTCGTDFELFQSFAEDALKKCPTKRSGNSPASCASPGRGQVAKVFSAPGITFKGSGFYKTDSRSSTTSSGSKKSSSSSDSSDSTSSSSEKSDSTSKSGSSKKSDSTAATSTTRSAD